MSVKYEHGIVQVVRGEHAGKVGWYDDDDFPPERAIVYFGTPLEGEYFLFLYRDLREATAEQKAEFERKYLSHLNPDWRFRAGIHNEAWTDADISRLNEAAGEFREDMPPKYRPRSQRRVDLRRRLPPDDKEEGE